METGLRKYQKMSLVHGQVDYKNPLVRIFFYLSKQNSESAFSGHDLHKRLFIIAPKQRKVNKQILFKFTFTFFVILFVFLSLGFMLWIGGTCATKRRFVGFGSGHKPIHGQLITWPNLRRMNLIYGTGIDIWRKFFYFFKKNIFWRKYGNYYSRNILIHSTTKMNLKINFGDI